MQHKQKQLSKAEFRQLVESARSIYPPDYYASEMNGTPQKSGIWLSGLECGFCQDGKHDNFRIHANGGGYFCQKCRAKGGSIIDFAMQRYGLPFIDAVLKITGGVDVQPDPAMIQQREAKRREAEQKQSALHARAAQEAAREWAGGTEITNASQHLYLVQKRVQPHGVRLSRDALLIPLVNAEGVLSTVQRIYPVGEKRLFTGGKKSGCFHVIGSETDKLLIAEGYATAASLHEQTGQQTIMAVDAGNLKAVALIWRGKYPDKPIIICGDNDVSGTGQKAANEAALAVSGLVSLPPVLGMDWNDYYNNREVEA